MAHTENKFVIWDLDNCLSDDRGRLTLIDWDLRDDERGDRYHKHAAADAPNPHAVELFQKQDAAGLIPLIFTGRPITHEHETDSWINRHLLPRRPIMKVMRAKGDGRSAAGLKYGMLRLCINMGLFRIDQVAGAFDDRADVIEMYRDAGIPNAVIVRANDLCAYTRPKPEEK